MSLYVLDTDIFSLNLRGHRRLRERLELIAPNSVAITIVTAEEHQIGALAWRVSGVITGSAQLYGVPVITGAIGVQDRFGDSGAPWELMSVKKARLASEESPYTTVAAK